MYNNSAQPGDLHGYPNQAAQPAGHPTASQNYPSSIPPTDYGVRYSQGALQRPYQHPPPQNATPSAPSSVYGSSHGGGHPPPEIPTAYPMAAYSIDQFVADTQSGLGSCPFEVDKARASMLQVNFGCPSTAGGVLQQIYMKKGSMVAYKGDIKFEREGIMEHGMKHMLKKAVTSEGATLVKATSSGGGKSRLFLADENKMVTVLQLQWESVSVNGDDLLAFEPTLQHKIVMMKKLSAVVSGGLFNVLLSGKGCVAILSHGRPLSLVIKQGQPIVYTDPQATVAWSGHLNPDFNTDMQFKTLLGRGSGESFQMKFDPRKGEGFVVIQPFEEIVTTSTSREVSNALREYW